MLGPNAGMRGNGAVGVRPHTSAASNSHPHPAFTNPRAAILPGGQVRPPSAARGRRAAAPSALVLPAAAAPGGMRATGRGAHPATYSSLHPGPPPARGPDCRAARAATRGRSAQRLAELQVQMSLPGGTQAGSLAAIGGGGASPPPAASPQAFQQRRLPFQIASRSPSGSPQTSEASSPSAVKRVSPLVAAKHASLESAPSAEDRCATLPHPLACAACVCDPCGVLRHAPDASSWPVAAAATQALVRCPCLPWRALPGQACRLGLWAELAGAE